MKMDILGAHQRARGYMHTAAALGHTRPAIQSTAACGVRVHRGTPGFALDLETDYNISVLFGVRNGPAPTPTRTQTVFSPLS